MDDSGMNTMTKCPACGATNNEGVEFCILCFAKIGKATPADIHIANPNATPSTPRFVGPKDNSYDAKSPLDATWDQKTREERAEQARKKRRAERAVANQKLMLDLNYEERALFRTAYRRRFRGQIIVALALLILAVVPGVSRHDWQPVEARVVSADEYNSFNFLEGRADDWTSNIEMEYEYKVGDRTYRSRTMEYSILNWPKTYSEHGNTFARQFVAEHSSGKPVQVFYSVNAG